jgi:hypothetical protein
MSLASLEHEDVERPRSAELGVGPYCAAISASDSPAAGSSSAISASSPPMIR